MKFKMEYKNADSRKIIYISGIIINVILCCIFFYLGVTYQKKDILEVNENPIIRYKVNLQEDAYFNTPEAGNTERYISSMIEGIDINFDYLAKVKEKGESKYKYTIESELIITDKNDTNHKLWLKKEKIKERENFSNENIKFSDSVTIDYQSYNSLVKSFNQIYTLQTNAKLYVRCKVEVNGKYSFLKDEVNYQNEMVVEIPLNETTILITPNVKNNGIRLIEFLNDNFSKVQGIYYLIGGIFFLGTLYCIIRLVMLCYHQYKTETNYEKKLRKLLRNYDDIIVMSESKPYFKAKEIIRVTSFEELLDAQVELREPVIFYMENDLATFIIRLETCTYVYILEKDEELEQDENKGDNNLKKK